VSAEPENPDQVIRETIRLRIPCEHCGETAMLELTPEAAARTATALLSASDGLERVEIEVRGDG
jgi:hypothetical protein